MRTVKCNRCNDPKQTVSLHVSGPTAMTVARKSECLACGNARREAELKRAKRYRDAVAKS